MLWNSCLIFTEVFRLIRLYTSRRRDNSGVMRICVRANAAHMQAEKRLLGQLRDPMRNALMRATLAGIRT
jgi:hypothetical protein